MLRFESAAFPVSTGEDAETNPGVFGKSLAAWLSTQLNLRGVKTTGVIAEDFGWCIAVVANDPKLYVVCSNDGNQMTSWQVFAFAERRFVARLLGRGDTATPLSSLYRTVKAILEENPAIKGLRLDHDG